MLNKLFFWHDRLVPNGLRLFSMLLILSPAFVLMAFSKTYSFGALWLGIIGLFRIIYMIKEENKMELMGKLMLKNEITEKDEVDLRKLIAIMQREKAEEVLKDVNCVSTAKTVYDCGCDVCKAVKVKYI